MPQPAPPPDKPVNLTALAERLPPLPSPGAPDGATDTATHALLTRGDLRFEVVQAPGMVGGHDGSIARGEPDEIYVVISGEGAFRCADGEIVEFAAGDVLFVPAGAAGRFVRSSRGFRTWRIVLAGPPARRATLPPPRTPDIG